MGEWFSLEPTDGILITGRIPLRVCRCNPHLLMLVHNYQVVASAAALSPFPPGTFPHMNDGQPSASSKPTTSLAMVPQEVLEHIAFFAATDGFLGPPSGLVPLLSLNRAMHAALSCRHNPHLYAQIFASKFDVDAAVRRLGIAKLPATALTEELQRRSNVLKRIRARQDAKAPASDKHLRWILWTAYLMALESDGKNERQLLEYAQINEWLKEYLFDPQGASNVVSSIVTSDAWPRNSDELSLALWLFWYMLHPGRLLSKGVHVERPHVRLRRLPEKRFAVSEYLRHTQSNSTGRT